MGVPLNFQTVYVHCYNCLNIVEMPVEMNDNEIPCCDECMNQVLSYKEG